MLLAKGFLQQHLKFIITISQPTKHSDLYFISCATYHLLEVFTEKMMSEDELLLLWLKRNKFIVLHRHLLGRKEKL